MLKGRSVRAYETEINEGVMISVPALDLRPKSIGFIVYFVHFAGVLFGNLAYHSYVVLVT